MASPAALGSDQRHLLRLLDPMMLFDALLGREGADRLMARQGGGCGFSAPEGAPARTTSYEIRNRAIISPMPGRGPARVSVSAAQLVGFGAGLPVPVRDQMQTCLTERRSEAIRVYDWCHCGYAHRPRNPHTGPCLRHHPTAAEDAGHCATLRAVADRADALLADILASDTGQLALFS